MPATTVSGFNSKSHDARITGLKGTNSARCKSITKNMIAKDTLGNTFEVPDFTIKDILSAIPKKCYVRCWYRGMLYIFRDFCCCFLFGIVARNIIPLIPIKFIRGLAWVFYSFCVSLPYTGFWVMAHECGHQAFSPYGWLNDTTGWILHSYLLVPYFSWKYSHGKHHKATGHMSRDTVFVPATKKEFLQRRKVLHLSDIAVDIPLYTLYVILVQQLGGWIWYLLTNVTGQKYPNYSRFSVSHFNPNAPIFEKKDYWYIVLSDIGVLTQLFVLYNWIIYFGSFSVLVNWFLPYLFTNHWLVFITYLQHTDFSMPHYLDNEWTFSRGAAATIDRNFGFIGPFFFHDIIETHVLHHYCSRITFYNARIGTAAIKKIMGNYYQHSNENMWKSLWKVSRYCEFVEEKNGVMMFRNHNGVGLKPEN